MLKSSRIIFLFHIHLYPPILIRHLFCPRTYLSSSNLSRPHRYANQPRQSPWRPSLRNFQVFRSQSGCSQPCIVGQCTPSPTKAGFFIFSQTRCLFLGLLPALYDNVVLDTFDQCEATLSMLNQRPDVARHIQKLVIRFASTLTKHSFRVSDLVRTLAPKLDGLNTFIWDAEEMPQCDEMWFALQMS